MTSSNPTTNISSSSVPISINLLTQAIECAMNPSIDASTKEQAIAYCNNIKENITTETITCINDIIINSSNKNQQLLFFTYQLLEHAIRRNSSNSENTTKLDFSHIQSNLINLPQTIYADYSHPIKTKLALILVLLFKHYFNPQLQQQNQWTGISFITEILNKSNMDLFLRVSIAMHEEIVDKHIPRSATELQLNTLIKDSLRVDGSLELLTSTWYNVLVSNMMTNVDIVNTIVQLMGFFVSWIDIKLVVTEQFITMLYQLLGQQETRVASIDCFCEIVTKGMKQSMEKLQLFTTLNIIPTISNLPALKSRTDEDVEFRENIAKLVNIIGLELCKCWEMATSEVERQESFKLLQQLFGVFVTLYQDEVDDTTVTVFPFCSALINVIKKTTKVSNNGTTGSAPPEWREQFVTLLRATILKMKFDTDDDGSFGLDADDEDAYFLEMRKNLKSIFDVLATVDWTLFEQYLPEIVCKTYDTLQTGLASGKSATECISWSDAELALYITFIFGEARRGYPTFYHPGTSNLTPIGTMITSMMTSNISMYPHPSISPIYFENAVRYAQFFEQTPAFIKDVLASFVDQRGLRHSNPLVVNRTYYLFLRFIKTTKGTPVFKEYIDTILHSVQDFLVAKAPVPKQLQTVQDKAMNFDSSLYLFEVAGLLASHEALNSTQMVDYLNGILGRTLSTMDQLLQRPEMSGSLTTSGKQDEDTPRDILIEHLARLITSIGSISKGFPEYDVDRTPKEGGWPDVFKRALQGILTVVERLSSSSISIREAARYTFQRMVGCMGPLILQHLQGLLTTGGLLGASGVKEIADFLLFINLLVYKYKGHIVGIIDEIYTPLLQHIFQLLNQQVCGTDDEIQLVELRKAYLSFILSILNNGLADNVITSQRNMGLFETTLNSVLHFAVHSMPQDPASCKQCISVLGKFCVQWVGGVEPANEQGKGSSKQGSTNGSKSDIKPTKSQGGGGQVVEGFEPIFMHQILPILFTIPLTKLDLNDAATTLVLQEISNTHRLMYIGRKEWYMSVLSEYMLNVLHCQPPKVQEFLNGVLQYAGPSCNSKQLRKFITEWFKTTRNG